MPNTVTNKPNQPPVSCQRINKCTARVPYWWRVYTDTTNGFLSPAFTQSQPISCWNSHHLVLILFAWQPVDRRRRCFALCQAYRATILQAINVLAAAGKTVTVWQLRRPTQPLSGETYYVCKALFNWKAANVNNSRNCTTWFSFSSAVCSVNVLKNYASASSLLTPQFDFTAAHIRL